MGGGQVTVLRRLALGLVCIAVFVAGCQGRQTAVPPILQHQRSMQHRVQPLTVKTPSAVCWGTPSPFLGGAVHRSHGTSNGPPADLCVIASGQTAKMVVPAYPLSSDSGSDTCTRVMWTVTPVDPITTVSVEDNTTSTSCNRTEKFTIKFTNVVGQPQPSPYPGQNYDFPHLEGTYTETGPGCPCTQDMIGFSIPIYEPPQLQIYDLGNSAATPINSPNPTPSPLMVGQQITLLARASGGLVVSSTGATPGPVTWSLPSTSINDVVASYNPCTCPSIPTPEPVGSPGEPLTTASSLPIFFLTDGPKAIQVTGYMQLVAGNNPYGPILKATAETKYPIKTVTVNEASQTLGVPIGTSIQAGPWPVPQPAMDTCLAGTECVWGGAKAAAWTFSVTSPQQGAGEIAGAQIIEQWYGSQNAAGDQANYCTSATASLNALQFWLDNGFPYPEVAPTSFAGGAKATWTADDSPYTAWLYVQAAGDANNVAAWRTSYFQDFFMYRPTATGSRGSIWVTIEKSTWNFADSWTEASPVPGPFAEGFPVSKLAVTGTAPAVSTTLPTWTNAATNAGDPPCPQGQIITAAGRKIK
jgi:hypothetical protein